MSQDEEELYKKIVSLKQERDLLYNIFKEVDEMTNDKYTCSNCADETYRLFYAYNEYKKWKSNTLEVENKNES